MKNTQAKKVQRLNLELPHGLQINDLVNLDFKSSGKIGPCRIKKAHITEHSITYDVELISEKYSPKFYNIHYMFIELIESNLQKF